MSWINNVMQVNQRAFAISGILLLLFFPLDWVDGFIDITIAVFVGIGNFLFAGLLAIVNFILGALIGLLDGVLDLIASSLNSLIPWGNPFPTSTLTYSTIPYTNMVAPSVNLFNGGTFGTYLLSLFGVVLPL